MSEAVKLLVMVRKTANLAVVSTYLVWCYLEGLRVECVSFVSCRGLGGRVVVVNWGEVFFGGGVKFTPLVAGGARVLEGVFSKAILQASE